MAKAPKAIYLELHPETKQHVAGGHAKNNPASEKISFAAETAKATGQNERTIRRDAERGEKVIDEVMDLIRGFSCRHEKLENFSATYFASAAEVQLHSFHVDRIKPSCR